VVSIGVTGVAREIALARPCRRSLFPASARRSRHRRCEKIAGHYGYSFRLEKVEISKPNGADGGGTHRSERDACATCKKSSYLPLQFSNSIIAIGGRAKKLDLPNGELGQEAYEEPQ
jgi:hypothetical protein